MKIHKEDSECNEWKGEKDPLTQKIIGCAIEVHRLLGPGLLESVYQHCLANEFVLAGLPFKVQTPIPIEYKNTRLNCGYRVDFIVQDRLILEIKAVEQLLGIHEAQLIT